MCLSTKIIGVNQPNNKNIQEGVVLETLPGTTFKVRLSDGSEILAHLAGKMRLYHIRVLIGDRVKVELSPYDKTKGRIVFRDK